MMKNMSSKERVLALFAKEKTDRVPLWVGMSSEFEQKCLQTLKLNSTDDLLTYFGDDFRIIRGSFMGWNCGDGEVLSTFGIPHKGIGYGQPTFHPFSGITRIEELNSWKYWPSAEMIDVSQMRKKIKSYDDKYAIISGDWSPFWHDAIDFFGMEQLFLLMFDAPEIVHAVMKRITDFYLSSSEKMFREAGDSIDIMFLGNDFGSQQAPLISPEMFEEFILPYMKFLIDLGHSYNLKVQLHSCGSIADLLPLLINAGLDSIQALQCVCCGMNLPDLKNRFGNKIVLNGGIDSHHVLINGDVELVRRKTIETLQVMDGVAYIAGASHDSILNETPVENIVTMCKTICEY